MLARLDQELVPARSSVNREGTLLRLEGVAQDQHESLRAAVPALIEEMGFIAEPFSSPASEDGKWYSVSEVSELSAEEARVLTDRWLAKMVQQGIFQKDADRARSALESVLLECFLDAARTGKVELDADQLSELPGLDAEEQEAIRSWLLQKLGRG